MLYYSSTTPGCSVRRTVRRTAAPLPSSAASAADTDSPSRFGARSGWYLHPESCYIRQSGSKSPRVGKRIFFSLLESHPEAEIHTARHRETSPVDTGASRSSHRRAVAVHDWVQPSVVGAQEQIGSLDERARVPSAEKSFGKSVTQLNIPEPHPVDVLLDKQLFAHVGVVARLNRRDDDDVVHRRIGGTLLPIFQDARNDQRVVSIQRRRGETVCRQVMLGRIKNIAAPPEIEQEVQRQPIVLEGICEADRIVRLPIVARIYEGARSQREAG